MKFKCRINAGKITKNSTKKEKKEEKKRYHKLFRKVTKEAIKNGFFDMVPTYGKFKGWAD